MSVFSIFSNRKRSKQDVATPSVEQYYETSARKISYLRWFLLLLTVLFLVYGFLTHSDELTTDNFRYMLKFLSFAESDSNSGEEPIRFDYADDNQGALYKGDLVVLNGNGLSLYSSESTKIFSSSFRMDDPRLYVTESSIYAYDLGNNEVRIFNSYSQIATLSLTYPVYDLSASDTGTFAIISSEKNYRTAIFVYDEYARQIYRRLLSDTYADFLALSEDAQSFLMLGHYAEGGYLISTLQLYDLSEPDPLMTLTFSGEFPLKVSWISDDTFMVLTSAHLRCFHIGDNSPYASISLDKDSLLSCTVSGNHIILATAASGLSGGTILTVYDSDLSEILRKRFDGAIDENVIVDDTLYVLSVGNVDKIMLDDESATSYTVSTNAVSILVSSSGEPFIFEKNLAVMLSYYADRSEISEGESS